MTETEALALATHRHYKGGLYRVIGVARHSETEEAMTVYEHLWPHERGLWVRPTAMFDEMLEDGTPRFKPLCSPARSSARPEHKTNGTALRPSRSPSARAETRRRK